MTAGARFAAYKWALALAAGALQSIVYFGIGHAPLDRSAVLLETAVDRAIPFLPWTAWMYLPFYAGVFVLAIAGVRSPRLYHRAMIGVLATMLLGALGHLLVAAEYPRPRLTAPYDASTALLAWVHAIDPPGNVFPSLHVAHTSALALILRRERPRLGAAAIVMATLLAVSTLTTKQHFVADVIAGFVIAALVSAMVLRQPGQTATETARASAPSRS